MRSAEPWGYVNAKNTKGSAKSAKVWLIYNTEEKEGNTEVMEFFLKGGMMVFSSPTGGNSLAQGVAQRSPGYSAIPQFS